MPVSLWCDVKNLYINGGVIYLVRTGCNMPLVVSHAAKAQSAFLVR